MQQVRRQCTIVVDVVVQNILIVEGAPVWHVKVADFGLSKNMDGTELRTLNAGTLEFMAPELRKTDMFLGDDIEALFVQNHYTVAVDLWSLGVMMLLLLTGKLPFPNGRAFQRFVQGCEALEVSPGSISDNAGNLILGLLELVPLERTTASQASSHQWTVQDAVEKAREEKDKVREEAILNKRIWSIRFSSLWQELDVEISDEM